MEAYTLCEKCSGFLNNLVVNTGQPPLVETCKKLFKSLHVLDIERFCVSLYAILRLPLEERLV